MAKCVTGIFMLLCAAGAYPAFAQRRTPSAQPPQAPVRSTRNDTTIKGTTLEVYQVYQPELKPMVKPELSPTLPLVAKEPAPQQYEVPQQTLKYAYRSLPLRPLALGRDSVALPPQSYALLAGGNLSTMLAEAGLGGLHGRNWHAATQARYITQDGQLEHQLFRSFGLKGAGEYQTSSRILNAGLSVERSVFGRYGYDHDALHYTRDEVRMAYSAATLTVGAQNLRPGPWGITYHPQVSIGAFDARQGHEITAGVYLPATKYLDSSLSLQLAVNGQFAWTAVGNVQGTNHIFQIAPALNYLRNGFSAHLGISPTIGEGDALQFLPDIHVAYGGPNSNLSLSAGWVATRIQNTLQQLTKVNPYVMPGIYDRVQSQRQEVFGGLGLALGRHMSIWGRAAWQHHDILPLFVTQPGSDGKEFSILYEQNVRAIVWGGGIRYAVGEDFSIGAEGNWYNFYHQELYRKCYGEPAVRLKGDASWHITDGLLLTTYLEVLDKIWGRNAAGQDVEQRGVFDFGAGGEYTFASRFSILLRADNLLGRKNERWLGYPSFGFNIYGGLRFRF